MSTFNPIQDSFYGGEISPRFHAQTRNEKYSISLAECTNWIPTPYGTLQMRQGSEYIVDASAGNTAVRLFNFTGGGNNDAVIEVGDTLISVLNRDGRLINSNQGQLLTDPTFIEEFRWWSRDVATTGAPSQDMIDIAMPSANQGSGVTIGSVNRTASPVGTTIGSVEQVITTAAPTALHTFTTLITTFVSPAIDFKTATITIGTTPGASDVLNITETYGSLFLTLVQQTFTPGGGNTTLYLKIAVGTNDAYQVPVRTNSSSFSGLSITNDAGAGVVSFASPYTAEQLPDVQVDTDSARGTVFFVHPNVAPQELKEVGNAWTFAPVTFAAPPLNTQWTGTNQPATVAIFQGRLWMGGAPNARNKLWGSESGNYYNFAVPASDPTDASPLEFELATNGTFQWMEGHKRLIIGTDVSEVIGGSDGSLITSSDFSFESQSNWGSSNVQAIPVGVETFMVTADSLNMRALFDNGLKSLGYDSEDISHYADQIVRSRIVETAYAKNPFYQVVALLGSRDLALCIYKKEEAINAWHRFSVDGDILSITASNDLQGTSVWIAVSRDGAIHIEVFNADEAAQHNLDSYLVKDIPANRTITGLDHLEGRLVTPVIFSADASYEAIHPQLTVAAGSIQLEDWVDLQYKVVVGLPYVATAKLLPMEGTNQRGTSLATKTRYVKTILKLNDSAIPLINGQRSPDRPPADLLTQSPMRITGDINVRNDDWESQGQITISQDIPLRTEVLGVFGIVSSNKV